MSVKQAAAGSFQRNRELSLLLLALIVGGGAITLVALGRDRNDLTLSLPIIATVVASYAGAHVAVRKLARAADHLLLPVVAVLNTLGLAAVYRLAPKRFGPAQVTWTVFGLALLVAVLVFLRDYKTLGRFKYLFGFAGVGLLLLPLSPLGREINGAQLWISLGPLSFQPGEAAKLCLVVFFAGYVAERKELLALASRRLAGMHLPDLKHFGPLLVMWGLSLAVMFYEKDLGSSMLFFSIFLVMIYMGTARVAYLFFGGALFAAGAFLGYRAFGHVQSRVQVWFDVFNPELIDGPSYQLAQSMFALSTGGLFGTGLGQGRPDLIPEAHTDFIFSVIGEELGLFGTSAVVVLFMLVIARGMRIALNARDDFGQLLAAGLTAILGLQTIIILGGITRLLPLTGITLPFVSYGGSSLLANFVLIALLIRVSHQNASEPDPAHTAEILIGGGPT
ncbi:MAG TPA: FtsW/RodA/SpoVE family cell cycle protein [Actinomycetota bacterium]|nr:FtsW/RodA/SpoVE family cell cycle protein [Actinomycetota bacterium]